MTSSHFLGDGSVVVNGDALLLYHPACHSSHSLSSEQTVNCGYDQFGVELQATGKQTSSELELNLVVLAMEMDEAFVVLVIKASSLSDLKSFYLYEYEMKPTLILLALDSSSEVSEYTSLLAPRAWFLIDAVPSPLVWPLVIGKWSHPQEPTNRRVTCSR